jgi:hypothetical protein
MRLLNGGVEKPPTVETIPPADDWSVGLEALELAELAGLNLDDWQMLVVLVGLARKEGLWAAFEVALVISRQTGKSEVLIALILWALYTERADPRREIFLRLRFLLEPPPGSDPLLHADPFLLDQVKSIRTANGEESVELHNGRRVRFLARTSGSGRGFTGDLVLLDEAYKLNQEQMAALLPTMGARPNPQIWYASMGPFEDSEVQLSVMERARSGSPGRLCYLGWEAPPDAPVDDRDWWVKCNPAHPHRMSMETLENEFQALGREGFAREKLCMRVSNITAAISFEAWQNVQNPAAAPVDGIVLGVDMNPEQTHAALVAADRDGNVELVDHRLVAGLVGWVIEVSQNQNAPVAVDNAGPARHIIPDLEAAGVEVVPYGSGNMASAAGRFLNLINEGVLKVRSHPAFDAARAGATQRPLGDSWAWGRRKSSVDISPLVAATLAVDAAVNRSEDAGLVVYDLADY